MGTTRLEQQQQQQHPRLELQRQRSSTDLNQQQPTTGAAKMVESLRHEVDSKDKQIQELKQKLIIFQQQVIIICCFSKISGEID